MRRNLNDPPILQDKDRELFGAVARDEQGNRKDLFSKGYLRAGNDGWARWDKNNELGSMRYGPYAARLRGGRQTGWDDWAGVVVEVDNMPLVDLKSIQWSYRLRSTEAIGPHIAIHVMDPANPSSRADISLSNGDADLPKTAGWHTYQITGGAPIQLFNYNNNTNTALSEEPSLYTLSQYQSDVWFKHSVITKITVEWGFYNEGDLDDCFLVNLMVNGVTIKLEPDTPDQLQDILDPIIKGIKTRPIWRFGQPELRADNSGWAKWERVARNAKSPFYNLSTDYNRQFRYGNWVAHLNGGLQSGDENWAQVCIPINDIPLSEFSEIAWTWYKFLAGTGDLGILGPHLVLQTYNPDDHDERADISQQASHGATVTEGWHEDIVVPTTTGYLFWWGNNVTSDITEGALETLATFQADKAFGKHVVYMLRLEYGYWGSTRSAGDVWVGKVRVNGEDIPLIPDTAQRAEVAEYEKNMFGKPVLRASNHGRANWSKWQFSKGGSGITAELYGGVQDGWNDWASVYIPVNEIPVSCFNAARWAWNTTEEEAFGVNMVIWVHDPYDFDIRAEITQQADHANLEKTAGWNGHELNPTTDYFYYYGEGISNTSLITGTGPGNLFGWDDFQGDERFNTMTIYRISFEWGWNTGDAVFENVWVSDISLNNQIIPLGTEPGGRIKTIVATKLMVAVTHTADEIIAQATGTDWDFAVGGNGVITKATVTHDSVAAGQRLSLLLFTNPPSGATDDEAANDNPTTADTPYYVGRIDFPALVANGTGDPSSIVTPSTVGNLPIYYDSVALYGILVAIDEYITVAEALTITLTVELEDN